MSESPSDILRIDRCPPLTEATLVLAFTGWMDGGDVSTGTVQRLVDLLAAPPIADPLNGARAPSPAPTARASSR